MSDAIFIRCPLSAGASDAQARAVLGHPSTGWPLLSLIEPAEAALFATDQDTAIAIPAGAAGYTLEQASDTGPVAEAAGALMLVAFDVPHDRTAEVDRWYDEEHIRLLMRADGWLRARRYRVLHHDGGPRWTSMAFHELRDAAVMDSPERAFARSTAWRAELEKEAWFGAAGRGLFRPLI